MLRSRATRRAPEAPPHSQLPAQAVEPAPVARLVYTAAQSARGPAPHRPWPTLRALSFVVVVLAPVALAAFYYLAIAADQFVAEFRLSLRTADAPRIEPAPFFGSDSVHATAASESQIVAQFIASRAIVDQLDPGLDLRKLFSPPAADWWARLALPAEIERVVLYWQNQVDPFYDTSTGTIVVRIRAFSPEDALRLAQAVVTASENLVNDLSARARRDAVGYAQTEVAQAEARLKAALAAIREFRDKAGMIDPGKTADATAALATKLRDDLMKANSELATLKAYMRDDAPPIRVLKARIRSLETQQRGLARELTDNGVAAAPAISQSLGSYETLEAERKFAETAYQHALEGLDRARDSAERQHLYVASFVPPSLPEMALYPHRWRALGLVALVAFAVWAVGGLAVQSIRDHI
jgi:capsular polysaccharide transport system permease protein